MVKNILDMGVGGVIDAPAEGQADAAGDQCVADVAGVRDRAGEPVELGHDQSVAGAHGGLWGSRTRPPVLTWAFTRPAHIR
jgi:hypothetical protein